MPTAISHLIDFSYGRLTRKALLRIVFPLILLSYFGSLMFAIWMFPGPFDWRTKAISKLLYPQTDTRFHTVVSAGLATTVLFMIPFAGYIGRRLRVVADVPAQIGALVFGAGAISLIFGAVIVFQPLHELFARSAGICLSLGILAFYLCALRGLAVPANEAHDRRQVLLAWSLILPPASLVVVLRLLAGAHFQWSNPLDRVLENRSLWHLGFWEWIISAAVFLFLLAAALFLPESGSVNGCERNCRLACCTCASLQALGGSVRRCPNMTDLLQPEATLVVRRSKTIAGRQQITGIKPARMS